MQIIKSSAICGLESLRGTLRNDYHGRAVAKSTAGRENPSSNRRYSAPTITGAFFVSVVRRYGGCAWARFGVAGFLFDRFLTPRTVASSRVRTVVGDSKFQVGVLPMASHSQGASAHTSHSPSHIATALIGAQLIAFRVNRRPDQLSHLLGLLRMASALGHVSPEDHAQLLNDLDRLALEGVNHA